MILFYDDLKNYYTYETVVNIAHRISTVKNTDNIIVLNQGEVVYTGNHLELVSNK